MAMATVRRRAVCALAVLVLLCGCCFSVCGATPEQEREALVDVFMEFSCQDSENKLSWRLNSKHEWRKCALDVNSVHFISGNTYSGDNAICAWGGTLHLIGGDRTRCSQSETEPKHAFTMSCKTHRDSAVRKLWEAANANPSDASHSSSSSEPSGVLMYCGRQTTSGERTEVEAGSTEEKGPSGVPEENAHGGGSAGAGPKDAVTEETPPTPSTGGDGGSATTTTTTSSPSGGKHAKGNADGSGTPSVWVRGTLLLLLTAAVACAAGD
ncbi:mucin-like glycoprotein [Trypanosoma rangeli]|uniref:Mucin-like glycoprotein n=1 Tax=Trypanosoma rangeli TaxID=5698 RepID=A0A3R7JXI8_TRYRA|nr:mucin-like glycoprotein [Trypanosoma rangeli]RNE97051.1 mucin-like glycoprotein [Trypanosoma rangeli]|eukprot:RNE97051.1 mucin-like glycoprotein [Trypanosoma rangeli]